MEKIVVVIRPLKRDVSWEALIESLNRERTITLLRADSGSELKAILARADSAVLIASEDDKEYSYPDWAVAPRKTYYYWLEAVDLNGPTELFGPVKGRLKK